MVRSTVLANAVATVVGVGYVLCRLMAAVVPQFLFDVGQSWFHTLNLEPVRATRSMSMGMFVLGLVTSVIVSWIGAYATADLYARWAKEQDARGGPGAGHGRAQCRGVGTGRTITERSDDMRTIVAVVSGLAILVMVSGAGAQMRPMTPPPGSPSQAPGSGETPGPQSHGPMMGPEMMGGMMCPMMGQAMMGRQPMMGMGMGAGMMGGMMGTSDPKTMARMLKLRGDMMKAMGEVMLKHAQALEQEK